MNVINHEQAQQWLQDRLAGALAPAEAQALDTHLQDCPNCRRYAFQIEKLDAGLRRHFRESALTRPPARAAYSVADQVRANMFAKRILSLAGSLALVLGLIALVGVLASLTTQSVTPAAAPGRPPTLDAAQTVTATSLPAATPGPLSAADEIATVLDRLAAQNEQFQRQSGWLRTQQLDAGEGSANTLFYAETWQHYPQADGRCTEGLTITRPKADSDTIVQLLVWSKGQFADLTELRKGQGQVYTVSPGDTECLGQPGQPPAGDLARRLRSQSTEPRKDAGQNLQTVKAWYETLDDQPVFVVEARFNSDQAAPAAQDEQYKFSLETGLLLRLNTRTSNADGSTFFEYRIRYQNDFFDQMPAEALATFQQAVAELKKYAADLMPNAQPITPGPPLNAAEDIATVLDRLAGQNVQFLHQAGWVRMQSLGAVDRGPQPVFNSETWQHYPQTDGICTEGFMVDYPRPDMPEVRQVWSGGLYADPVIRGNNGKVKVESVTPADTNCVADPVTTYAGELAARLRGQSPYPRNDAGKDLQAAKAWYETLDEQPVFVVEAKFRSDQSTPPEQVEQYTFSLRTGLPLRQQITLVKADGSTYGETQFRIQTDYYSEAPAEVVPIIQKALADLQYYVSQAGAIPTPTPAPSVLETFPTSPDQATSDVNTIVAALRALRERHLHWLARPGWYLYEDPAPVVGDALDANRRMLVHSTGEGRCELMTFYRKGKQALYQEVRLADGSYGLVNSVEAGDFMQGSAEDTPCTLAVLESVDLLDQKITSFPDEARSLKAQFHAWIGSMDASAARNEPGRSVLVVVVDTTYTDPKPGTMDMETRQIVSLDRSVAWYVYDLETGMQRGVDSQNFLSSGKIQGELPNWSAPLTGNVPFYLYAYSPEPPADLAPVFEQAVERLQQFLKK